MCERNHAPKTAQTLSVQLHLLIDPMYALQVHQLAAAMKDLGTDLTLRVSNMSHESFFFQAICRICCFLLIWRMMLLPTALNCLQSFFYIFVAMKLVIHILIQAVTCTAERFLLNSMCTKVV